MTRKLSCRIAALACLGLSFAVYSTRSSQADDKKDGKNPAVAKPEGAKPGFDPKDVRVGPPPELAELRKAVEEAGRKGENVDEIRKQLDSLEKALAGKAWVKPKPKPIEDELPPRPGFQPPRVFPQQGLLFQQPALPLFPGFDPKIQAKLMKAQQLMLKAALLRGEDPEKAEALLKEARELLGAGNGLMMPPILGLQPIAPRGAGSRLGVRVGQVTKELAAKLKLPDAKGILVAEVVAGTPAEKAGLRENDVILQFNGKEAGGDPSAFVDLVRGMKPKTKVDIVYWRNGKKEEAKGVVLAGPANIFRGGLDLLPAPGFGGFGGPLPAFPLPVPGIAPLQDPAAIGGQQSSVSVIIRDGMFTIKAIEDGVKFHIEGSPGDAGKPAPTKIEITDGKKTTEFKSLEKVPAEYRGAVKKILESVRVSN